MNKKILFIVGGLAVVALLAGGAYMAVRLLNAVAPAASSGGLAGLNSTNANTKTTIELIPAPELPTGMPDVAGDITDVKDNSLFVSSQSKAQPIGGPVIEVVIVQETKIYRDVTRDHLPTPDPNQTRQQAQMVVELSTSDQLVQGSFVSVWGQPRGDRLVADVVLVMGPQVVK
jgi:hypothetical protein